MSLCENISTAIALESCSNPQGLGSLRIGNEKKFFGSRFFVSGIISGLVLGLFFATLSNLMTMLLIHET